MKYRVEALAAAASVSVDTLRFYQARGLIPAPRREGRVAVYDETHLERLRRVRGLQDQGFSLAQIRRLLETDGAPASSRAAAPDPLLQALVAENVGARTLSREELAAEAGVPEPLVRAAESAGLIEPLTIDGEARFNASDLEMARTGIALLSAGFPLERLLGLAVGHARHVQEVCDAAIELFDAHVRKRAEGEADPEQVTAMFRQLLPQVTRLVALHFQRTLVNRALGRLRGRDEDAALEAALAATRDARLDVEVRWR